jgi:hypothetical protein
MEFKINIIAVFVAVVVNFVLGFIWYTPLFGKIWGKEMGYDPNMKPDKKVMMKGMAFMIIGNFLFAWVLAWTLAGFQYIPGAKEMGPMINAINSAIFLWLGFYLPGQLGAIVWEKKSWKLFAINTGYSLVSLLVVALILSHWT